MSFLIFVKGRLWVRERNVAVLTSDLAVDHIKDLRAANGSFVFPILSEAVFSISCSCASGQLLLSNNASSSTPAVVTWNKGVKAAVFGDVPQNCFVLSARWLIIDLRRRDIAGNTWTAWSSVNCIINCPISSTQHTSSSFQAECTVYCISCGQGEPCGCAGRHCEEICSTIWQVHTCTLALYSAGWVIL